MVNIRREDEQVTGRVLVLPIAISDDALSGNDEHELVNVSMVVPVKGRTSGKKTVGERFKTLRLKITGRGIQAPKASAAMRRLKGDAT